MDSGRLVYINGKFVKEKDAKISIFDSALMFGDMVFEMTRSFNKKQFKLKEHLERLYYGIKIYRIPMKLTMKELENIVDQLESGDIDLEKSVKLYEKGMLLKKNCEDKLKNVELQIKKIKLENNKIKRENFIE